MEEIPESNNFSFVEEKVPHETDSSRKEEQTDFRISEVWESSPPK